MRPFLLDANVLIAIVDLEHDHHRIAATWFQQVGHRHWLTCPTTENGATRVLSLTSYPRISLSPEQAMELVTSLCSRGNHRFVADEVSLLTSPIINAQRLLSSKQVSDTYLLALATSIGAVLATLDRRLTPIAVDNGANHLHNLLD